MRQALNKQQELQVRRQAQKHLSGIPARQNAATIELLETLVLHEEIVARIGADEIERCNALAELEPCYGL